MWNNVLFALSPCVHSHSLTLLGAPRVQYTSSYPDGGYRNHVGVAHSWCYKLLVHSACTANEGSAEFLYNIFGFLRSLEIKIWLVRWPIILFVMGFLSNLLIRSLQTYFQFTEAQQPTSNASLWHNTIVYGPLLSRMRVPYWESGNETSQCLIAYSMWRILRPR